MKLSWNAFDFRSEKEVLSAFVCGCHCVVPEGPQVVQVRTVVEQLLYVEQLC